MMSEAPQSARYAIIAHVVHLVNRDYLVSHEHGVEMGAPAAALFGDKEHSGWRSCSRPCIA